MCIRDRLTLISGLICLALGVFLLLRSDIVVSILPIVFGLFVIFDACLLYTSRCV